LESARIKTAASNHFSFKLDKLLTRATHKVKSQKRRFKMKETDNQTILIHIDLTHRLSLLLMLAILAAGLLAYLAWGGRPVTAASPQAPSAGSTGLRQYYLTPGSYNGAQPVGMCASGYHMASLWEIWDTSNLEYNTTLGITYVGDQGVGPPTYYQSNHVSGWVHTGADDSADTPGKSNCENWTVSYPTDKGTIIYLDEDWTTIEGWKASQLACNSTTHVWCVED
jgi:hypothetical protein